MIASKEELRKYIKADIRAFGGVTFRQRIKGLFVPNIYAFEKKMRVCEYYRNCRQDALGKFVFAVKYLRYQRYSIKLGYTIPLNVFGPGLCLCHYGTIVIHDTVRFGKNARIHADVNIGNYSRDESDGPKATAPIFGDNVYIGPGAKVFGGIRIGNDVAIGANSVVTKDVPDGVSVAGIPAKIINHDGSQGLIIDGKYNKI